MSRASVLAILAGAGIFLTGSITPDSIALARAIQAGDVASLHKFANEHRDSPLVSEAMKLAKNVNNSGSGGKSQGNGPGGTGSSSGRGGSAGNPGGGKNGGKGNAGY